MPVTDVFVSYSRADKEFVDRLVRDLELRGLKVFFDVRIAAGEPWADTLRKAIEDARYVLVVLSPEAVSSEWIRAETMLGLQREAEGKATVIPLMLRECDPPLPLYAKTWADFREDYQAGLQQLMPVVLGSTSQASLAEDTPGGTTLKDPVELERQKKELTEAAEGFTATPKKGEVRSRTPGSRRRRCFIVMPFGNEALQIVYEDFVRPVIEIRCDLDCERGDDVFGSSVIMDDIRGSIDASDIVVADLTGKNANVFYEVGICHTLDKPVLLIAQSIDDVPFDLRHRRVLLYEYSPRGCKKLEQILELNLKSMLKKLETP